MKDSNFFFKTTLFDLRVSFIFFFIQNIVGRARTKAPASHGARVWVWFRARVGWGSRFAEGRIQKDKGVRQCLSKKRCSISKRWTKKKINGTFTFFIKFPKKMFRWSFVVPLISFWRKDQQMSISTRVPFRSREFTLFCWSFNSFYRQKSNQQKLIYLKKGGIIKKQVKNTCLCFFTFFWTKINVQKILNNFFPKKQLWR